MIAANDTLDVAADFSVDTAHLAIARATGSAASPHLVYEAADGSPRRKKASTRLESGDHALKPADRKKVVAAQREAMQNQVLLGWMVRKYLDFIAGHNANFATPDRGLNRDLRQWVEERSKKANFDVRGRQNRRQFTRLLEARRLIDGDVGALKLRSRHLQPIEGDRIRQPAAGELDSADDLVNWTHGVKCNAAGRATAYAIHRRRKTQFEFERIVAARRLLWHACYESTFRFDACRGVSPITTAINELADFKEAKEYARTKLKVASQLGLVIYSDAADGVGFHNVASSVDSDNDGTAENDRYEVDMGQGAWKLELDGADRADLLDSKTGATETVDFLTFCILVFLKAVDLPMSYFREDFTNFFGSKIATILMLMAARNKREEIQAFLCEWLAWQLRAAIQPSVAEITLPRSISLDDVLRSCAWIPDGMPWFDRAREVKPALQAIAGGIESMENIVQQLHGVDLDTWLSHLQAEQDRINDTDVQLVNFDKADVLFAPDSNQGPQP